ncbi:MULTISPECIES: hypothetical protein [Streptomyces]|uniref:hypothetical protein n=1 Tax=Streptomyces TaxID=1883 RepID=UPI00345B9CB5
MTVSTADTANELREELVTCLIDSGHLRTPEVIAAFRDTERHRFLPGVDLQAAYAHDVVALKRDETGEMISCISTPSIVATQLEQLGAEPGHKILEAGAATGYNAALLGRLVAPSGHVWTVDVDQDLVDGARKNLAEAGGSNVNSARGSGCAAVRNSARVVPNSWLFPHCWRWIEHRSVPPDRTRSQAPTTHPQWSRVRGPAACP